MPLSLVDIDIGTSARVVELTGGRQLAGRLEAMGILPGAVIVKKSAAMMRGPVVVQKGGMNVAIGYGMARRIMVEPGQG
jgi:ferrous iron transport protein A